MGNKQTTSFSPSHEESGKASASKGAASSKKGVANGDTVEAVVCQVDDLKSGEMREVEVEGQKILLAREQLDFYAVGAKCTHYNAPLVKGALCNGRVRCPFHGACFNLSTGDIEDFPGLDSLPKYEVEIEGKNVKVRTSKKTLQATRRTKPMAGSSPEDDRVFLILGGGGAGVVCAETLRQEGFKGKLILATREQHLPYDRPKLSKALDATGDSLKLRDKEFFSGFDIEVQTGKEAESLDTTQNCVKFTDGTTVTYNKLLICTGGSPRRLGLPGEDLQNVFSLRTPEDGNKIIEAACGKRAVVIGNSFIGMEVAAYLIGKADTVTVLSRSEIPFRASLGEKVGNVIKEMHISKGTQFTTGHPAEFVGEDNKLTGIKLQDGSTIEADVCVLGIGVTPNTSFLSGSGIETTSRGYITVNSYMQTNVPSVYAAGDVTSFPCTQAQGCHVSIGHWQLAGIQGRTAALSMVDKPAALDTVHFFWTMQFGKSIRYAGYNEGYDDTVIHGEMPNKFVIFYLREGKVVAAASLMFDPVVSQVAEVLRCGKTLHKEDISEDPVSTIKKMLCS